MALVSRVAIPAVARETRVSREPVRLAVGKTSRVAMPSRVATVSFARPRAEEEPRVSAEATHSRHVMARRATSDSRSAETVHPTPAAATQIRRNASDSGPQGASRGPLRLSLDWYHDKDASVLQAQARLLALPLAP